MIVYLIVAVTLDGFITRRRTDLADWTSRADKEHFKKISKEIGAMVMGQTTFETIGKALPGRKTFVLSETKTYPDAETLCGTPKEVIEILKNKGLEKVAICGGASVYTSFMKSGLVDKLIITKEPVIFGSGVPLFTEELNVKIELEKSTSIGDGAVVLEYRVVKNEL